MVLNLKLQIKSEDTIYSIYAWISLYLSGMTSASRPGDQGSILDILVSYQCLTPSQPVPLSQGLVSLPRSNLPVAQKVGTPVATWRHTVSTWAGWPGVSMIWPGDAVNVICNFCPGVAARTSACIQLTWRCTVHGTETFFFFLFSFFFFFCVPQLYLWGSPLLGEIFAYVTVF